MPAVKDHSDSILWPADARAAGLATIGGKAAGLVRLERAGAPVPPWFAVGAEAYARHAERALGAELLGACSAAIDADDTEGLATACAAAQAALLEQRLNSGLEAAITLALERLGEGPYAVRSSMIGEDDEAFSFAGQLETYLHQADVSAVCDAVIRCWSAALAPRVLTYRKRAGLALVDLRMAVIVQRMINGTVSGVLFTVDPTTGNRQQALLSACWGLGEGVVDGSCNTDEFVWDHAEGLVDRRISDKDRMVVPRQGGSGTEEIDTPVTQRNTSCLADDEVEAILSAGLAVAHQLGAPQDIEWTIGGGTLYLLQARPITSLPPVAEGPRVVWDNSNIQESYCGVTTPLTFSFASAGYASVYAQTMRALGLPEATVRAHDRMLRNMLGLVRGRVYYNIQNWYRGLLLLPSFGRNKADMERMMGLDEPVDFIADETPSWVEKLGRLPRILHTGLRMLRLFRALPDEVPRWQASFEAAYRRADRGRFQAAGFSALMAVLDDLRQGMLDNWSTPIINDFYVMMSVGRLRRVVERAVGSDDAESLLASLLAGEEGIESTEPVRQLLAMAAEARAQPALAATLRTGEPLDALAEVRANHAHFAEHIAGWLERYGDRCMGELKLETVSLREDPGFVVQVLRNYLDREDLDPQALARRERELRAAAEDRLRSRLGWFRRARVGGALRAARQSVKQREAMRLQRTRMFGLYRDVYLALGQRLQEAGRLDAARDVFYLTTQEIEAYHEGRAVTADLAPIARARRAEYAAYEALDLPHRFETWGPVYDGNRYEGPRRELAPDGRHLRGIGCYPGVVEGELKVVLSPRDELSVNGRILTTVRTDPGWAPLFPTCGGLLIERGSTLSHSAVIARELGIPAVVGVPGLLSLVRDGERVRLDGGAGTVERLDAGEAL